MRRCSGHLAAFRARAGVASGRGAFRLVPRQRLLPNRFRWDHCPLLDHHGHLLQAREDGSGARSTALILPCSTGVGVGYTSIHPTRIVFVWNSYTRPLRIGALPSAERPVPSRYTHCGRRLSAAPLGHATVESSMVIARQPLTPAARLIAGFLAAVCLMGSGLAVILAITRPSPGLAILALPVLALGVLYAGAAWRGHPWIWRRAKRPQGPRHDGGA